MRSAGCLADPDGPAFCPMPIPLSPAPSSLHLFRIKRIFYLLSFFSIDILIFPPTHCRATDFFRILVTPQPSSPRDPRTIPPHSRLLSRFRAQSLTHASSQRVTTRQETKQRPLFSPPHTHRPGHSTRLRIFPPAQKNYTSSLFLITPANSWHIKYHLSTYKQATPKHIHIHTPTTPSFRLNSHVRRAPRR